MLINTDEICVINLLKEEGKESHHIPACLKIVQLPSADAEKPEFAFVFRNKIVTLGIDTTADTIV